MAPLSTLDLKSRLSWEDDVVMGVTVTTTILLLSRLVFYKIERVTL